MSRIEGKVVFVTGANRGIGRAFVEELLAAGAAKVYAAARNKNALKDLTAKGSGRIVPVELDVTKPEMIETAAAACKDVEVLINNAGIAAFQGLTSASDSAPARTEMETNYFGSLNMIRSFAPTLAANGGGTIVNMSSIAGLVNMPVFASYSASKAAVHSLTQGARAELAGQETLVVGVYPDLLTPIWGQTCRWIEPRPTMSRKRCWMASKRVRKISSQIPCPNSFMTDLPLIQRLSKSS